MNSSNAVKDACATAVRNVSENSRQNTDFKMNDIQDVESGMAMSEWCGKSSNRHQQHLRRSI